MRNYISQSSTNMHKQQHLSKNHPMFLTSAPKTEVKLKVKMNETIAIYSNKSQDCCFLSLLFFLMPSLWRHRIPGQLRPFGLRLGRAVGWAYGPLWSTGIPLSSTEHAACFDLLAWPSTNHPQTFFLALHHCLKIHIGIDHGTVVHRESGHWA